MTIRGEPVRGAFPEPGFYSLPGIEQAQALRRGLIPRSPLAHLTGVAVTDVGPGTASVAVPASPWLETGDGVALHVLAEAALSTTVLAGVPPATDVRTASMSITQFRPATLEADKIIAHGRTVRSTTTFSYAEVMVEDDLGREIARVNGAVVVRPRDPSPPAPPPPGPPVDQPLYASPDPYLRPLPRGVRAVPKEWWETLDGLAIVRLLLQQKELVLPVFSLFGFAAVGVEHGRPAIAFAPTEWLCFRNREVVPGVLTTLIWQAAVAASMTLAPPARRLGIINLNVRFFRPVAPDGRDVVADARVTEQHGDWVVASVRVTDADDHLMATGEQTSVLLPRRERPAMRAEPVLVTVLFTDLVGSTARATQLGDTRWKQLLAEHESAVRRHLANSGGREIKTTGDGFLATFDSPARAVRCAQQIIESTRRLDLEVRVGIHTGQCQLSKGDVTGIAVHVASRVLSAAEPQEVLVSGTVHDLLLGSDLKFEDRGRHQLKGIEGDWQLFALVE